MLEDKQKQISKIRSNMNKDDTTKNSTGTHIINLIKLMVGLYSGHFILPFGLVIFSIKARSRKKNQF